MTSLWPIERIGFYEGQASAFYNVSAIERDYFEMWYFDNLGAYKSAAHGNLEGVEQGHRKMEAALESIGNKAREIRDISETERKAGIEPEPSGLWQTGAYTDYNREHN